MDGSVFVTRSLHKNEQGYFGCKAAFVKSGAFDAFNQMFTIALADYPQVREVAQEMEIIDQMNLDCLSTEDFRIVVRELDRFFMNLNNATPLQNLARRVWQENVFPLVLEDPRY